MNPTNTPMEARSGPSYSGQPDLSKMRDTASTADLFVSLRKRKQPDNYDLRDDLKEFREEISELFSKFIASHEEQFHKLRQDVSDVKEQFSSIKTTCESICREHTTLKVEVADLTESLNFHIKEQTDLKSHLQDISTQVTKLSNSEDTFQKQLDDLQKEINLYQQKDRLLNLEISGIPERRDECVSDYLIAIAKFVGVQIHTNDIVHIHRVQPRVPQAGRPKNIVAQLSSIQIKDSIISGVRRNRGITSLNIGFPGEPRQIYVNEHLSPFYKNLYKKARDAAKSFNYRYVWVRNCKIYVRRDDTSSSIQIKETSDLNKIK